MNAHRRLHRLGRAIRFFVIMSILIPLMVFAVLWTLVLRMFRIGPNMGNATLRSDH